MIAPISGEVVRRALRTAVVTAIALAALETFPVQILIHTQSTRFPGIPDFWTMANVVLAEDRGARATGITRGDRIDYSLMPVDQRYGSYYDGLRAPPPGKAVSYVVEHDGKRRVVKLAALGVPSAIGYGEKATDWKTVLLGLTGGAALIGALLVIILLGLALALIRPAGLTAAFLLFVAQCGALMPSANAFLPPWGYAFSMVLSDTLAALGAVGFLALALYLDPRRRIRTFQLIGAGALLLAVIVVPVATSDVLELMGGARPAWPLAGWASFLGMWFCYAAGIILLLRLAVSVTVPVTLRLIAALLAVVGAVTIFNGTIVATNSSWYFANLPAVAMNRWLQPDRWETPHLFETLGFPAIALRPLALLVALCLIVRSKIIDTGPVLSRMVGAVIIVLLVVAVFAFANILLTQVFPGNTLFVPMELFAALAISYWVSGLRDVAGSMSFASVDAWSSWAKGHSREERDALTHALRLAERTRQPGLIAEVRAQIVFSSWRDGDDAEFERNADALVRTVGNRSLRGLRGFALAAASHEGEPRFADGDFPEWKARAALLQCAQTNDAACAQRYAVDALASANDAGLGSLQVLASVAVAETSPGRRDDSLERAHAIARDAGWPALSKSILALRANARDIGILQSFVEVRLRKSRPARPAFEISFFNAELRQNGTRIPLAENELELLLAVASAPAGANDVDLIDDLWPESDGDAARNAFRVCLHRLRKKSGDARIVTRVGKGYVVHPWADVDLWRFQSLIAACRERAGRGCEPELHALCDALRAGEGRRATLGEWFHRFEQVLTQKLDEADQLLNHAVRRA